MFKRDRLHLPKGCTRRGTCSEHIPLAAYTYLPQRPQALALAKTHTYTSHKGAYNPGLCMWDTMASSEAVSVSIGVACVNRQLTQIRSHHDACFSSSRPNYATAYTRKCSSSRPGFRFAQRPDFKFLLYFKSAIRPVARRLRCTLCETHSTFSL